MSSISITRLTLFVPGTAASVAAWNTALQRSGLRIDGDVLHGGRLDTKVALEWIENDGAFGDAFSFGTVSAPVVDAIDAAPGALVLHWPVDLRDGRQWIIEVVESLRDAG